MPFIAGSLRNGKIPILFITGKGTVVQEPDPSNSIVWYSLFAISQGILSNGYPNVFIQKSSCMRPLHVHAPNVNGMKTDTTI